MSEIYNPSKRLMYPALQKLIDENAQLKADIDSYKMTIAGYVKAEELYRLEIKALISVRGQMEQGAALCHKREVG